MLYQTIHVYDANPSGGGSGGSDGGGSGGSSVGFATITGAEYFVDTDPGEGNGTAFQPQDGAFDSEVESILPKDLNVTGLSVGPHLVGVRYKDNNNTWGDVLFQTIHVYDANPSGSGSGGVDGGGSGGSSVGFATITGAEYFVDTDPGEGSGTAFEPQDGAFDSEVEAILPKDLNVTGLSVGPHLVGVRYKDNNNTWGDVLYQTIHVYDANPDATGTGSGGTGGTGGFSIIAGAEYFIGEDPGEGNATALQPRDGAFDSEVESTLAVNLSLDGYVIGVYLVGVRYKDNNGTWGDVLFKTVEVDVDTDGDGLADKAEAYYETNSTRADTDGDGYSDGEEVAFGSDPTDPNSLGNQPPSDHNSTAVLAFQENQPVGTVIGEFNATDPDGHAITYHFLSGENNNSLFTLDTNGTLKTATTFDYESNASSYTITVQAKDELNATTEGNFTVTLLDVYEDTDGDGFRDSLEASTGSNLNDPTSTPLQQGLVAWYPFDGNASDMSGNGNHGTVNGATLGTDRHGVAGKAYSFDGVDDKIVIGDKLLFSSSDRFTISAWILKEKDSFNPVLTKWPQEWWFGLYNSELHFTSNNDGYGAYGASKMSLGANLRTSAWTLINITRNENNLNYFVQGLLFDQEDQSYDFTAGSTDILIGSASNGLYYKGQIDDIHIYDRALSADEISLLYRAESPNHFVNSAKDLEMIWVEPGTFTMGQTGVAEPEHNVTLTKGFYLGKYEVTQAQYEAVMLGNDANLSATPSNSANNPNRPVEKVSWRDVQVFLARLNEKQADSLPDGWAYVLPTEAQWEYACRAVTTTAYSWGDTISPTDANWDHGNDANQTENVGQYSANPWGFFDMHGNVWEWTADAYASFASGAQTDPFNDIGSSRILRGGSFSNGNYQLKSSRRFNRTPSDRPTNVGFRLALRDINKAPTDLNSTAVLAFQENQPVGTIIGEFNATDPDGHAITYHFVSGENNNSFFTLDTNGTLKTATTFDYESNATSYTISVQAKDELNATTEGNFTVTLLDVYEDTDGDGFRDSLEASTGSNLNDPTSTPLQQGLVAWYPFDGNASDMSGNGNHGTVNGATLGTDRHGVTGKAYSFDGVDDWIDLNGSAYPIGNGSSISFWAKRDFLIQDNTTLISAAGNKGVFLKIHLFWDGLVIFDYGQGISTRNRISHTMNVDFNQWNLWAWTRSQSDNSLKIFKNGVLLKEDNSQTLLESGNQSEIFNFFIGKDGSGNHWKGILDELKIYNRALSAEEISLLYRVESPNHFVDSAKDLEMIWVEPGTFTMGQTGVTNAEPEHNVTLTKGFYLGKYEVTQAQYEDVMQGNTETNSSGDVISATPSNFAGNPNRPVERVSWEDIQVFLTRLNEQQAENLPSGWAYVLPTEAQWEYACRAGTTTAYSWGETISASDANYNGSIGQTTNVGSYSVNPWGFFDMHGNVWEWTADAVGSYITGAQNDPLNVGTAGSTRVSRGGSWGTPLSYLRSAGRGGYPSSYRSNIGFRLALRDMNKAPTDLNSTTVHAVLENLPAGQIIGEFNATDPDGHAITYHFVNGDNNNSLFTLDTNGTLKTATTFIMKATLQATP